MSLYKPTEDTPAPGDSHPRLLLPLGTFDADSPLVAFSVALCLALDAELTLLNVIDDDQPKPAQPDTDSAAWNAVPHQFVIRRAESVARGIAAAAREHACDLIVLGWQPQERETEYIEFGEVHDEVLMIAPCDVLLLTCPPADQQAPPQWQRLLVFVGDERHTVRATALALALARTAHGHVTLLRLIPETADTEAEATAHALLDRIMSDAGIAQPEAASEITRQVLRASHETRAVLATAEAHDAVFVGVTGNVYLHRFFLSAATQRLVAELPLPAVIVRRAHSRSTFRLHRLWLRFRELLPALVDAERLEVYKQIRRGARGTFDFYTLIFLAVVIATMGLLLNSGAVIIGAMLVAPLMTPILALGMSVVAGDARLLRLAAQSTLASVLVAVGVSALLAWMAPFALLTTEVEARTHPNLFDLTVALAAGAAGAFGVARRSVASALSGVAVAAALVPPLSVIGICLATQRYSEAGGAALLFGTNLVAISIAAAAVYLLLGFLPYDQEQSRSTVRRYGWLAGLILLFVVTVPLARTLAADVTQATLSRTLRAELETVLHEETDLSLFDFEWTAPPGQPIFLRVIVYARDDVTAGTLDTIKQAMHTATGREVNLQVVSIPTSYLGGTESVR